MVAAWGSRRHRGGGSRGGGVADLPREGDEAKDWHVRLRVLRFARPSWLRPTQQLCKDMDWLINAAMDELLSLDPYAFAAIQDD
jgi:hypothetical protein